ncbi:MAG: VOC family protein [Bacteroidales bacterium]|nr:VOC family protein [Bacteroidales bacterium]MDD4771944.1 VOC family protein [Bacteroidales bacterium]
MKFNNVRLLVKDYRKCFNFYTQLLGLEAAWDVGDCYASFKVANGIEGFALFTSDLMAPLVGNDDKAQPVGFREKSMLSFEVENVDECFLDLLEKGLAFINMPTNMPDWGMRVVHLYDPEENLIELFTPLATK